MDADHTADVFNAQLGLHRLSLEEKHPPQFDIAESDPRKKLEVLLENILY